MTKARRSSFSMRFCNTTTAAMLRRLAEDPAEGLFVYEYVRQDHDGKVLATLDNAGINHVENMTEGG